jgi:hypothetical protein
MCTFDPFQCPLQVSIQPRVVVVVVVVVVFVVVVVVAVAVVTIVQDRIYRSNQSILGGGFQMVTVTCSTTIVVEL